MSRRTTVEALVAFEPAPVTDYGRSTDPPDPEAIERAKALGRWTIYLRGAAPADLAGKRVRMTVLD